MRRTTLVALPIIAVVLLMFPAAVNAQALIPHVFVGRATIDGSYPPAGTSVTAVISQQVKGTTTVKADGTYSMVVAQGNGTSIQFFIGSAKAAQTGSWEFGGATDLDLTAGAVPVETALAKLIQTGSLERVFRFDNATKTWEWYINDPAFGPFNTLQSLSSGDLIWVKVTREATLGIFGVSVNFTCANRGQIDENCWNAIKVP